jgi:putative OPT family oligopeptide transporter
LPEGSALDAAWSAWSSQIRYMGVGAMIVGGIWSMVGIRHGIVKAMREAVAGFRSQGRTLARTEQDLPTSKLLIVLVVTTVLVFFLYQALTGSASISLVASLVMVIASFFFVAVSSYIVGLVGSSNNPISGMTICALIFASVVLLLLGMTGTAGIVAALGVAGVVCCAAASAGDTSQDLKTGYLVGATPWRQQIAQLIGTIFPSLLIAPILTLLQKGYGIGTGGPEALRAPQATLFASIAKALFEHSGLPWNMVILGAAIAIALVVLDEFLRTKKMPFRAYVMPVAVGIYLPMSLSVPILAGGLASYWLRRTTSKRGIGFAEAAENRSILLSSGLIAGEAVAGILIAVPRTLGVQLPIAVIESDLITLAALAAVTIWVYRASRAARPQASA